MMPAPTTALARLNTATGALIDLTSSSFAPDADADAEDEGKRPYDDEAAP